MTNLSIDEMRTIAMLTPIKIIDGNETKYLLRKGFKSIITLGPFVYGSLFEDNAFARVQRENHNTIEYMDIMGNISSEKTEVGKIYYNFLMDLVKDGINLKAIENIPYEYFSDDNFIQNIINLFSLQYYEVNSKDQKLTSKKRTTIRTEGESLAKQLCENKILFFIEDEKE